MELRRLTDDDADELLRVVTESLPLLREWMIWAVGDYTADSARGYLDVTRTGWEDGTLFNHAIVHNGAIVGVIGVDRIDDHVEIGYWLHPAATGQGLATRATREMVAFAFGLDGVDRVRIWHDEANLASRRIPERLGFTELGRHTPPREPKIGSKAGVDVLWELKRSEFRA